MFTLPIAVLYISIFISLFFEVFILITYFETRDILKQEEVFLKKEITHFPSVSIIVPSFNEETTVAGTTESLLALDYPEDKLRILLVDDGSTDKTFEVMNRYMDRPQIRVFTKTNEGSKYSALNFGLTKIDTDLVGCLDADSFVAPNALKLMVPFFKDPKIMAVTPSIKISNPKKILQYIQKMEYTWGVFFRRMLSTMGALYVTPGPFSIFRTTVFEELGGYREAHHTEDMELALRMQKNGYKIVNSVNAYVYTVAPDKFRALYKQRVRWTYGFLNNAYDYRDMYFKPKYGHVATFILPIATLSIFTTLYAAASFIWGIGVQIVQAIIKYRAVGFTYTPHIPHIKFDPFFINTSLLVVLGTTALIINITLLLLSTRMAKEKKMFGRELFFYVGIYLFIVPFWLAKATYNTVFSKKITWR